MPLTRKRSLLPAASCGRKRWRSAIRRKKSPRQSATPRRVCAKAWSGDIADLARRIIDYAHEHNIDLTYERQAFGERDIDMTKVNDIVDHVR